jgi:hypothetical protein
MLHLFWFAEFVCMVIKKQCFGCKKWFGCTTKAILRVTVSALYVEANGASCFRVKLVALPNANHVSEVGSPPGNWQNLYKIAFCQPIVPRFSFSGKIPIVLRLGTRVRE